MEEHPVNRRTLTKGALWSVPIVTLAAPAPATAASPAPELSVYGRGSWNRSWDDTRTDGYRTFKFYTTPAGTTTPGPGLCVDNTNTSMTISGGSVTYYIPYSYTVRFYSGTPGTNGWSALTVDYSKSTKVFQNVTYFPYTTQYTGSVTARNGTTCFPSYAFESQQNVITSSYFFVDNSAVVDGRTLSANFGPVAMVQ